MSDALLRRRLLEWYDAHKRPLPWRRSQDPYRVWLSEIMLQQTTVATVIPYYERFLSRFPDVRSLAAADEAEVLRLWAGLGYYSRAKNLLAAAREVVRRGGSFPQDPEALRALPGVGRYTAGAVASIAFSRKAPLVDGNVIRVFSRLFAMRGDPKSPSFQNRAWARAESLVDARRPGDWNQALMELGATVCLPAFPLCASCPLSARCLARAQGLQDSLPRPARRKAPVPVSWTALVVRDGSRLLLMRRDEGEKLLPGHWGLPEPRHLPGAAPGRELGRLTHSITNHRITLAVRESPRPPRIPPSARWATPQEAREMLVSSIWRKALEKAV